MRLERSIRKTKPDTSGCASLNLNRTAEEKLRSKRSLVVYYTKINVATYVMQKIWFKGVRFVINIEEMPKRLRPNNLQ